MLSRKDTFFLPLSSLSLPPVQMLLHWVCLWSLSIHWSSVYPSPQAAWWSVHPAEHCARFWGEEEKRLEAERERERESYENHSQLFNKTNRVVNESAQSWLASTHPHTPLFLQVVLSLWTMPHMILNARPSHFSCNTTPDMSDLITVQTYRLHPDWMAEATTH